VGKQFPKQTIRDVNLHGKTILLRADYNVPLTKRGQISDDLRIRASLPTLNYLLEQNCKIVIMSHLGRPRRKDARFSLKIVAKHLEKLLDRPVKLLNDCVGESVRQAVRRAPLGSVLMLENLRFYDEEEADDLVFARSIQRAVRADYFVQDGFAVAHRAHASTHAISLCVPGLAGLLLEKEYTIITKAMSRPKRPLVAIIGGAKISDKISLIKRLINKADQILIGGAMSNTFLYCRGVNIGRSIFEPGMEKVVAEIYELAAAKVGVENVDKFLVLPVDVAVAPEISREYLRQEVDVNNIKNHDMALDIGSRTIDVFTNILAGAKTVIWNGPLGYAEIDNFAIGSARVALAIAQNTEVTSIVGGGDTADFILKWDGHDGASFTHVSTGGGASMALMAGKKLPGIESLLDAYGLK
jgi:phosphoglycerate kinase